MALVLPPFTVSPQEAGHTLAKVLRSRLGGPSWNDVRKLIAARRVKVGDAICSDDARRLKEDEVVVLLEHPKPLPRTAHPERLVVRHLDEHVVVVEKPYGREHRAPPGGAGVVRTAARTRPHARRPDAVGHRPATRPPSATNCRGFASSTDSTRRRAVWWCSPARRWPSANSACSSASTPSSALPRGRAGLSSRPDDHARTWCQIAATADAAARTCPTSARKRSRTSRRGAPAGLHAALVPAGNGPHAPDSHPPLGSRRTRCAATRCM